MKNNHKTQHRTPFWVWLVIAAFALIDPLQHVWIAFVPPSGFEPTGLHIKDSAFFLTAMDHAGTDFHSPYATCEAAGGNRHYSYFPLVDHYIYGLVGIVAGVLHVPHFFMLAFANAFGIALLLFITYHLFRQIHPPSANWAFAVYTFGGGLGGVTYLVALLLGWNDNPNFDSWFLRFGMYELFEHGYIAPHLILYRLYYTLSLSACLAGTLCVIRADRTPARSWLAGLLFLAGTATNLRVGILILAATALYLLFRGGKQRWRIAALAALGAAIGGLFATALLRTNPALTQSYASTMRAAVWFSPLLLAHVFHLPPLMARTWRHVREGSLLIRVGVLAFAGYLVAFALLYAAYLGYYGNFLDVYDGTIAMRISDYALIGGMAALPFALLKRPSHDDGLEWVTLWMLAYTAIAISAFGQGWFLRFTPARLIVVLGFPIAILTGRQLYAWSITRPRLSVGLLCAMTVCGASSIVVAVTSFQGPLGHWPDRQPYAFLHSEYMSEADAALINQLPEGRVLAPATTTPVFGDVIAVRNDQPVVYGVGTLVFSDTDFLTLRNAAAAFFSPKTTADEREAIARRWCVDYVLCPDTTPVRSDVRTQLDALPWLKVIAREGDGVVYEALFTATGP